MALVPSGATTAAPVLAEVEMDSGDSSSTIVRATIVQAGSVFYDTPATLDKAERLIAEAASYGAQLVVFPEAFVGGYPRGSSFGVRIANQTTKGREQFQKYHASAIHVPGPEVHRLAAMAGKYKVFLVMGVIERDGYTLYCTVLFFDPLGGYLGKHRKLMPTALERVIWGFGDGSTLPVFETPIGKIGAAICWESRMPLLRMAMYAKGVQIYCAATAASSQAWQASVTHIAAEGGCFVLAANQFCRRKDYPPPPEYVFHGAEDRLNPDSVVCRGGSVIISPSGTILAGPNYEGEALISADLDMGEIARAKSDFDVVGHYARPDILSLTVRDHPATAATFTSESERERDMVAVMSKETKEEPVAVEVEMGGDATPATVRATIVQACTVFYDTPATIDKAERWIAEAAAQGAQLVVFPEAYVGGYPRGSSFGVTIGNRTAEGREEFRKYHASAITVPGPEVDRLAATAGKHKVYLVIGVIERSGYTLYCTILYFDPQGRYLGKHRKFMPTALERVFWGFGDGSTIPVFETPIGKIGAVICWENRMPLLRMAMYAKGVEIYCAPTADPYDEWISSMIHIAQEGGCFVLSANQFIRRKDFPPPSEYTLLGAPDDPEAIVCPGRSLIVSPSGTVLAGPSSEGEGLITADLDLGEIARAKFDFDVTGHYARPEVLSLTVRDHQAKPVTFTSESEGSETCHKS